MTRRSALVYGLLAAVWTIVLAWQAVEHFRVKDSARAALINRSKDISSTLGLVMRSQRHFGVISQDRLESALSALVKPEELTAVALLNATGEVVASAGAPIDFEMKGLAPSGEHWGDGSVTLLNLVDLGTNITTEAEGGRLTLVIPRNEMFGPFGTNRPGTNQPPPRPQPPGPGPGPDNLDSTNRPPPPPDGTPDGGTNGPPRQRGRGWPRGGDGRPSFGRPFWMSESEFKAVIQKKGVHSFVMVLSTQAVNSAAAYDLWLRGLIAMLAAAAAAGAALAWRNVLKNSDLQIRLVRASEQNSHLKEMNLAAAGLAHETRNPLNIIRGLAQMISRMPDAQEEIRAKSRAILDETDRVTAQLNEFINYSRPREVRRTAVAVSPVLTEVMRALQCDVEDKNIVLQVSGDALTIDADEPLLRQALFNLLLNAIQAVNTGGEIHVITRQQGEEASLEIRDNGPGVPAERRDEIFKPYFTTRPSGTGLGLAVAQQNALAHGWEISCLPNEPRGAIFRIAHLKLVG